MGSAYLEVADIFSKAVAQQPHFLPFGNVLYLHVPDLPVSDGLPLIESYSPFETIRRRLVGPIASCQVGTERCVTEQTPFYGSGP